MIEHVEVEQLPILANYSVAQIAFILNLDLSSLLFQKGFIPHLFYMDGVGWADGFIFKLDRDYFFLQAETLFTNFCTEVHTTSFRPAQQSIQILFEALNISKECIEINIFDGEIEYMSIQNQLSLQ
ncbi:hypothetical protein [Acinetobacter sp. CFCC 10889]|uniref:hypothetical protein n=1 Tax=Acinetobacter sp. CFCC 10889 TaxID=1775557 RepID=UPI000DD0A3D1|nr:hypothetical protein [Acinetobacter sp. CFCC 10889]